MKAKKSDIIAVAKAARVSPSTVSRRFNHPDLVKPDTRKRIDRAVQRLGYIRNRAAPTLHGLRSGTIAAVLAPAGATAAGAAAAAAAGAAAPPRAVTIASMASNDASTPASAALCSPRKDITSAFKAASAFSMSSISRWDGRCSRR